MFFAMSVQRQKSRHNTDDIICYYHMMTPRSAADCPRQLFAITPLIAVSAAASAFNDVAANAALMPIR